MTADSVCKDGKCCANYVKNNRGICVACPPGTFGIACSVACPLGYFGVKCLSECNCRKTEICLPSAGCTSKAIESKSDDPAAPVHVFVIVALSSICSALLIGCLVKVMLRKWQCFTKHEKLATSSRQTVEELQQGPSSNGTTYGDDTLENRSIYFTIDNNNRTMPDNVVYLTTQGLANELSPYEQEAHEIAVHIDNGEPEETSTSFKQENT